MKNIIKEILISQLSFPLKYKNEKEIWWEDEHGEPITVEITNIENEQCVVREYYENGQLWSKDSYRQGQQHGEWLRCYDNGQLWYKVNYRQGYLHGEYLVWHDNGQLRYKENYHQGQQHGECLCWYVDGRPSRKAEFNHGKLINEKNY